MNRKNLIIFHPLVLIIKIVLYTKMIQILIYILQKFKVYNIVNLLLPKAKLRKSALVPEGPRLISLLNFQKEHHFTKDKK